MSSEKSGQGRHQIRQGLPATLSFHSGDIGRLWRILSQKGQKLTWFLGDSSGYYFQSKWWRGEGRRRGTR